MSRYTIPQPDGTEVESARIPKSGVYRLTRAADIGKDGKDIICTGRQTDGTVTHADASSPMYDSGVADHHSTWCNASREHFGAELVERAASRGSADPTAARAARWARIAGESSEA